MPIPAAAHEYHIRKALNDAAFRGLDYVAFDPNMPTSKQGCPTDEVQFIWVSQAPVSALSSRALARPRELRRRATRPTDALSCAWPLC